MVDKASPASWRGAAFSITQLMNGGADDRVNVKHNSRRSPAHTHTTILEIIQDTILLDRRP